MAKKKEIQFPLNQEAIEGFISECLNTSLTAEECREKMAFFVENEEIDAHTILEMGEMIKSKFE